ncbi:MAG: hypothetical protein AAB664_02245, partial [Patescibacteria group bacterium]
MAFKSRIVPWGMFIVCAIVFLLGTRVISQHIDIFISPDETANRFFIQAFSQTGSYRVHDALNGQINGLSHPRSVITDGSYFLPVGFLGLSTLYAFFSFFFGLWILLFLTPLIALLAVCAWMKLLEQWFPKPVAMISGFILLFHPAFWYYASRGLMPNVLFVSMLIFAACFLYVQPIKKIFVSRQNIDIFLAGFFMSFALFVRFSEVYWILPCVLAWFIFKRLQIKPILFFLFGCFIPMSFFLFLNAQTYGDPFTTGYQFISSFQQNTSSLSQDDAVANNLQWLFPFGIHLPEMIKHTFYYFVGLFSWMTVLAGIGVFFVWRSKQPSHRHYLLVSFLIALWLIVWYGSWILHDNPDPKQITIANSYVRYWLPLFILSTPFIASACYKISAFGRTRFSKRFILGAILLVVFGLNTQIVFFRGEDALLSVSQTLKDSKQIRARVFDLTPSDAVLIVDRADKLFFPYRHVMYPLRSETTYAAMPRILDYAPLFYYGVTFPKQDLDYLNQKKFVDLGLTITFIQSFGV